MENVNTKLNSLIQNALITSRRLVASGDAETACSILQNFINEEGEHAVILRELGRIKMLQKRPHEAVPLFERVLELIDAEKIVFEQKPILSVPLSISLNLIEQENLSDSDLSFIESVSHEMEAKRNYYEFDDDSLNDATTTSQSETISQYLKTTQKSSQVDNPQDVLDSVEFENILDESFDEITEEELFGLDFSQIIDETTESESLEDIPFFDPTNLTNFAFEYSWEEYEPVGVEYDDEITENEIFSLPTENRLTRLERARQVALELGDEYDWDEDGIDVLTKIFFKHGWNATRRSMRWELDAGVTPFELLLAEKAREIWFEYTEFSEARHGRYGISHKYLNLSWPNALLLIRSFGAYPDPAEIEKLLIDLYDTYQNKASLIDAYGSFTKYLEYHIGRGRSALRESPWLSFDANDYEAEAEALDLEGVDKICSQKNLHSALLELGIHIECLDIHRIDSCLKSKPTIQEDMDNQAGTIEKNNKSTQIQSQHDCTKNIPSSKIGDMVKINSGRFKNYEGQIIGINITKQKFKILISLSCQWTELTIKFDKVINI